MNWLKKIKKAIDTPIGEPRANWVQTETYFIGMKGPALVAQLDSESECVRELKLLGYRMVHSPSLTSRGLEWERHSAWGRAPYLNVPNEERSLAVIDVASETNMKIWEITAIFWCGDKTRISNLMESQ